MGRQEHYTVHSCPDCKPSSAAGTPCGHDAHPGAFCWPGYPAAEDKLDAALVAGAETSTKPGRWSPRRPGWSAPRGCCPVGVKPGRR